MTEASTASPATVPAQHGPSGRRTWVAVGALVLAVAVLIGIPWVAGGFEQRTDLQTVVAPGTTVTAGPYEFTFSAGTVQKTKTYSDAEIYRVVLAGTGRVTGNEAMTPDTLNWRFIAKDPRSPAYKEPASQQLGAEAHRGSSGGSFFTPGLPAIPYRLTFDFPADELAVGPDIRLGVRILDYRDTSLLQTGDFRWAPTDRLYRYDLPLRRLADDLD
ncbi:MAG TPA: hypothetical protein VIT41_18235 [Microlunatus sp.]